MKPPRMTTPSDRNSADNAAASSAWPVVPGYELLREVGRGGMGIVYQARQQTDQRLVALKFIRDGAFASPLDRARLRIEAEAVSRLDHPNIVRILEVGEALGQPFLAMEYIEGARLDHFLNGRTFPAHTAACFIQTLAHAIQHIHDQQILHRDLKPANILLEGVRIPSTASPDSEATLTVQMSDLETFTPRITDFGLAKRLDSDSTAWTQAGVILGTVSYMSPEQAAGNMQDIGVGADIYALGVLLYELLAGRPPFRAETWTATIQLVLHEDPQPPSKWSGDEPGDLDTICLKCLEKAAEQRYTSAAELAADLQRFLTAQPIAAEPLDSNERMLRRSARAGYTILREIGRGSCSTVYEARFGPMQQPMALKVFDRNVCSESEWNARLQTWSPLWSALRHPQVILPTEAGWWEGTPFLAMEFAPQGSLADALATQRYSVKAALRLVEQLAEVVCYLHRQGITHGNLKPSNILIAADGIPRVADLHPFNGLSFGTVTTDEQSQSGMVYRAPERLDQPTAEPGPFLDIYGLGAILYELLTGKPPFAGTTSGELSEQIRSTDPPSPMSLNRKVSPAVDALCMRCLRKTPWQRFSRVYDLLTRLRDLQSPNSN